MKRSPPSRAERYSYIRLNAAPEQTEGQRHLKQPPIKTRGGLEKGGGEPRPRPGGEGIIKTELIEDAYHYAADLVSAAAGWRDRLDKHIQRLFAVARVERRESPAEIQSGRPLESDPGSQALSSEASANVSEDFEGLILLPAAPEDPCQQDGSIGLPPLRAQCSAGRLLLRPLSPTV